MYKNIQEFNSNRKKFASLQLQERNFKYVFLLCTHLNFYVYYNGEKNRDSFSVKMNVFIHTIVLSQFQHVISATVSVISKRRKYLYIYISKLNIFHTELINFVTTFF